MEAVAPDAFGVEIVWNRVMIGQGAVAAMEGGIKTRDLREIRVSSQDRPDRRKIVRLVKRRQRCVFFQSRQYGLIDPHRPVVIRAAVHHAMSDGNRVNFQFIAQPCTCCRERRGDVMDGFALVGSVDQHAAIDRGDTQSRAGFRPRPFGP